MKSIKNILEARSNQVKLHIPYNGFYCGKDYALEFCVIVGRSFMIEDTVGQHEAAEFLHKKNIRIYNDVSEIVENLKDVGEYDPNIEVCYAITDGDDEANAYVYGEGGIYLLDDKK